MIGSLLPLALLATSAIAGWSKPQESFIAPLRTVSPGQPTAGGDARNNIIYTAGNKVLTNDVNLYMIYYGAWTEAQKQIVNDFANGVGASSWYKLTKLYYYQAKSSTKKIYANGAVKVAGSVSDAGSLGNSLSGNDLPDLVQKYINSGAFPEDENAIYFIATGAGVTETIRPDLGTASFCSVRVFFEFYLSASRALLTITLYYRTTVVTMSPLSSPLASVSNTL